MPNADEFLGAGARPRAAAIALRESLRARGKRVVFTNGCFDVVHAGHVAVSRVGARAGRRADRRPQRRCVGARAQGPRAAVRTFAGARRGAGRAAQRRRGRRVRRVDAGEVLLDALRPDVHVKSAQYRHRGSARAATSWRRTAATSFWRRTSPARARPTCRDDPAQTAVPMRLAITSNGPGEFAGWVRPLLHALYARRPGARRALFFVPDDYATGTRSRRRARDCFRARACIAPGEYLRFALGRALAGVPDARRPRALPRRRPDARGARARPARAARGGV